MSDVQHPKFEECLKKLEEIVEKLENNDLPLDEALSNFEQGIKLTRLCNKMIDSAERKINILSRNQDGSLEESAFQEFEEE